MFQRTVRLILIRVRGKPVHYNILVEKITELEFHKYLLYENKVRSVIKTYQPRYNNGIDSNIG